MSYYEEIVSEYLLADRHRFVSPGFNLDLQNGGPHAKDANWWIDVLCVDFAAHTILLCEVSYSQSLAYMFRRLRLWNENWEDMKKAFSRSRASLPIGRWKYVSSRRSS